MKRSAGILPYKIDKGEIFVYLAHPGGPYWQNKDSWSICKGEYNKTEKAIDAAIREFCEETNFQVSKEKLFFIRSVRQANNKLITIFGIEQDIDPSLFKSNTFQIEYPIGSGKIQEFPEMDKAAWFSIEEAKNKIFKGQIPVLRKLEMVIKNNLS